MAAAATAAGGGGGVAGGGVAGGKAHGKVVSADAPPREPRPPPVKGAGRPLPQAPPLNQREKHVKAVRGEIMALEKKRDALEVRCL